MVRGKARRDFHFCATAEEGVRGEEAETRGVSGPTSASVSSSPLSSLSTSPIADACVDDVSAERETNASGGRRPNRCDPERKGSSPLNDQPIGKPRVKSKRNTRPTTKCPPCPTIVPAAAPVSELSTTFLSSEEGAGFAPTSAARGPSLWLIRGQEGGASHRDRYPEEQTQRQKDTSHAKK